MYANGCYQFDILLPPTYPNAPPMVRYHSPSADFDPADLNSTFNDDGICLDLLDGEGGVWMPSESTLLQLLVSLQSLVLGGSFDMMMHLFDVDSPPARNDPVNIAHNETAKATIRLQATKQGVLDVMRHNSTSVFSDITDLHFYHKRHELRRQIVEWESLSLTAWRKYGEALFSTTQQEMELESEQWTQLRAELETEILALEMRMTSSKSCDSSSGDILRYNNHHSNSTSVKTSCDAKDYSSSSYTNMNKTSKRVVIDLIAASDDDEGKHNKAKKTKINAVSREIITID